MGAFVIATDSRRNDEVLFMVDRKRQRASFWSCTTRDALVFKSKAAAEAKVSSLRFNNPRVMNLSDAHRIAEFQEDCMADVENFHGEHPLEWDAHKRY